MNRQTALGIKLGLTEKQATRLAALKTPAAVQDFIAAIPANYEIGGETYLPVAESLRQNRAHCIEAAMIAACALWLQGQQPLLLDLKARLGDTDHVVALYKAGNHWGAISKSNHVWLRWRDPVYRSVRELALSYFHEFTMRETKTLVAYSRPFDLRRIDPAVWISGTQGVEACWDFVRTLDDSPHYPLFPKSQLKHLKPRDGMELRANKIIEHPKR